MLIGDVVMLVYSLVLCLILVVFIYSKIKKSVMGNQNTSYGSTLIFLSLWFIAGLRYAVGTDYNTYKWYFDNIHFFGFEFPHFERGYYFINYIVSLFTDNSQYLFLVTSFLIIFLFHITLKNFSVSYALSIFLFVTIAFYYESLNVIRQYLAVAITFFSIRYIINKNFKKFLLTVVLASFFHTTAIILVPFYWISRIKIRNISYFSILVITTVFSFFTTNIVGLVSKFIPKFAYYINYYREGASANTVTMILLAILIFSLLYKKKLNEIDINSNIYINLMFFGLLFVILSRDNIIFYRAALYFYVFILILIPICLKSLNKYLKIPSYIIVISIMTAYHYHLLLNNSSGVLPYNFNVDVFNPYLILVAVIIAIYFTILGSLMKAIQKRRLTSR